MDENTSRFRRTAALSTICSFSLAAALGVLALLSGDFGALQGRVLGTTLVVGCASVCGLCYLTTAGTRWAGLGGLGAVVALVPTGSALTLLWADLQVDGDVWQAFGVGCVAATTLAQVSLLLGLAEPAVDQRPATRPGAAIPVLAGTIGAATVLALLVSALILGQEPGDGTWRLLGVVAILDVLGTVVSVAITRFGVATGGPGRSSRMPDRVQVTLPELQSDDVRRVAARSGMSERQVVAAAVDLLVGREVRS